MAQKNLNCDYNEIANLAKEMLNLNIPAHVFEKVCKDEDFQKSVININNKEAWNATPEPKMDDLSVSTDDIATMRYILRTFKAWWKDNANKFAELAAEMTDDEIEAVENFIRDVKDFKENLMDEEMMESAQRDYEFYVEEKVKSILVTRKAKYDWVDYDNLYSLVCIDPYIEPTDERVDDAVAKDFFTTAEKLLKNGKKIEIDYDDFEELSKYLKERNTILTLMYINGAVTAEFLG